MFELRVLNGLHGGAALPLVGKRWMIGADDANDLVLHDPGVALRHCQLQREGGDWQVDASEGIVLDEEGHARLQLLLQSEQPFVLGQVWLCIVPGNSPWPTMPVLSREPIEASAPYKSIPQSHAPRSNRPIGIAWGILLGVVGSAWSLSDGSGEPAEKPGTASSHTMSLAAAPSRGKLNTDEAQARLHAMLSDRLLDDVMVDRRADGLVLHGQLSQESADLYRRMLQRFNDQYESEVAVLDEVRTAASTLPFVIVQIMSGAQAHVVTSEGKRIYVGDELDGLRLTRIDEGRLEFQGNGTHEVRW